MDFTSEPSSGAAKPGENRFKNSIGFRGDLNTGNRGKFSETQTEERLRIHAIALATGSPTYAQIVEYWKERFGIDIALQTEKEWRNSNKDRIEKKKHELIESGEIQVPVVSEEVLSDSMMNLTIQTGRAAQDIRKKAQKVLNQIKLEGSDNEEDRARNEEKLDIYKALTDSLFKLNRNMKDQLDSLFQFSSKIKIKDKKIQRIVDEQFDERMKKAQEFEDEELDSDPEITEEMRKKLLEG